MQKELHNIADHKYPSFARENVGMVSLDYVKEMRSVFEKYARGKLPIVELPSGKGFYIPVSHIIQSEWIHWLTKWKNTLTRSVSVSL